MYFSTIYYVYYVQFKFKCMQIAKKIYIITIYQSLIIHDVFSI